jgi:hypothetical protein
MRALADVDALLVRKRVLDARCASGAAIAARLETLRAWQASRLARTYADLRVEPRYAAAANFFLSDVYGCDTRAERDADLERAWRYLKRALPRSALTILGRALTLEVLSEELDLAMAKLMPTKLLAAASYASLYRRVGRADERRRQIELLIAVGTDLDRVVKRPWIGMALRAAHLPAHAAGCGVLQDFLERGFAAFTQMQGAREFLAIIRQRETRLMDALLSCAVQPIEDLLAMTAEP